MGGNSAGGWGCGKVFADLNYLFFCLLSPAGLTCSALIFVLASSIKVFGLKSGFLLAMCVRSSPNIRSFASAAFVRLYTPGDYHPTN